jgi:hypothetical protein
MKLRPTIFLSGVSSEFRSFRDAVEIEVQKKGCFPENQSSFGVDYRTVEEMLRRKLHDADAVIHIVGFRYGAEPKDRPPDKPRRSYTQMEYDIARELEKPIYVFLSADATICDAPGGDEDPEATALQIAHRQAIKSTNNLRYTFKDQNELRHLAAEIEPIAQADFRVDISRIDKYAPAELIGREQELALLNDAWLKARRAGSSRPHVVTFVALGGEGKTSLIAKWAAELAHQGWPGCDAVFAWSFYSQGTREQAASSDLFLNEALTFFGNEDDKQFAATSAGAYEKGRRLARIVGQRRSLLILDGLEPLQYAPSSPLPGELKDAGLAALLKGLAANSDGLCIVTTRYSLPDLKTFWQTTALEVKLLRLSQEVGVHLLKTLGVRGTNKGFEALVEDVKGHALSLYLVGTYLRDAHGGDIRRRDLIKLEEADAKEQGGHAFRVMEAYERAFEYEGDKGKHALAILRLLGLFDRPITADLLAALLKEPLISDLTEPLVGLSEPQRNLIFTRLEQAKLLSVNRGASSALISIDAHPLVREYFARQLSIKQPDGWRAAHRKLYEHLSAIPDKDQPTIENLQPLYQGVIHGCHAGMQQEACEKIYFARINRMPELYSTRKLGAFASDLEAVTYFFDTPWKRVSLALTKAYQSQLLAIAAANLRALGRLSDALEPVQAGMKMRVEEHEWEEASRDSNELSELKLTLGEVDVALAAAKQAVTYAGLSRSTSPRFRSRSPHANALPRLASRSVHANALHQAGRYSDAKKRFREAERMQRDWQPDYRLLHSVRGFQYCELLLANVERAAWLQRLKCEELSPLSAGAGLSEPHARDPTTKTSLHSNALRLVKKRLTYLLEIAEITNFPLDIGLNRLTFGRVALYEIMLFDPSLLCHTENLTMIDDGVKILRRSGRQDHLPYGVLTRALLRFLAGVRTGADSAQKDLDEAWEIAERGPMRLHMADIHLYRARLFFREAEYPWESPEADLTAAEKLINDCGYHRRDEELADAKRLILGQSV